MAHSICALCLLFLGLAVHRFAITGVYVVLCTYTLLGAKHAVKALSLGYIITLLNPALYNLPGEVAVLRWLLLFVAGLRMIPSLSFREATSLTPLVFFFATVAVLAWTVSSDFQLSFLKITVFTFCAATVLVAFNSLDEADLGNLTKWFSCLTVTVLLLSLPTLLVPRVGFFRNGSGFQGIFNHPQAFGVFLAPPAAYLAARLFLGKGGSSRWSWMFAAVLVVTIFLTQARTAMLALLLGLGLTVLIDLFRKRSGPSTPLPHNSLVKVATVTILLCSFAAGSSDFSQAMSGFWLKGHGKSVQHSFQASRGGGIAFHWQRFLQHPWTGNGFGIDVLHGNEKKQATFLGIPVSAPGEKGFLPAAFLEEVGIIGLLLFLPFFLTLLKRAYCTGDSAWLCMFFACLLVNIGEAVFFSPGQTGGYLWLLIGLSTAAGRKARYEF